MNFYKKFYLLIILSVFSLAGLVNGYTSFYDDNQTFCSALDGLSLYSNDSNLTFLGVLSSNKYDSNSIANKYGSYGSKYMTESIFNKYGTHGSKYSINGVWNKYTLSPPLIVDADLNIVSYLTVNKYLAGGVNAYYVVLCFIETDDDRLEPLWELFDDSRVYNGTTASVDSDAYYEETDPVDECGINSESTSEGKCQCISGYKWRYPDIKNNFDCVEITPNEICQSLYGNGSISDGNGGCSCLDGYLFDDSANECKKVSGDEYCEDLFGPDSFSDGVKNDLGSYQCYCKEGYSLNEYDQCSKYHPSVDQEDFEEYKMDLGVKMYDRAVETIDKIETYLGGRTEFEERKDIEMLLSILGKYLTVAKGDNKIIADMYIKYFEARSK